MRRVGGSRAIRVAAAVAAVLLVLLALAQLVLPRIAASRISSKVGRYGHVEDVTVSAWPAVKLLWGDADSVDVRAGHLALSPAQAAALLWEGRGLAKLDISARSVSLGGLALTAATLHKRGVQLEAGARTTQAAAQAALGPGVAVRLLSSGEGRVRVQTSGSLFGVGASLPAVAEAQEGALVARPEGLLSGFKLTIFSDRHVHVIGVEARPAGPSAYALRMTALLG